MEWTLIAGGRTAEAEGQPGWTAEAQALFAELQKVLSKPEYGCTGSNFGGNNVHAEPHQPQGE